MHSLNVKLDVHITLDRHQFLAHQDLLPIILERLAVSFSLDFSGVIERRFQAAKTPNKVHRTFIADSRGSGNVVD